MKSMLPDAEDRQFADELNKELSRYDTIAQLFSKVDESTGRQTYGLTLSRGSKRHTIWSELPFSWQGTEMVIDTVKPWLEGGSTGDPWFNRWSPDVRFAD